MKKIYNLALIIVCFLLHPIQGYNTWKHPNENLPYHKVSFLTAHNAFSNSADNWRYKQQHWGIEEQLNNGIRGLMLDTHESDNTILLCHGRCGGLYGLQKSGEYKTLRQELSIIYNWLKYHPQEIVTIILENYVGSDHLLKKTIEAIPGLAQLILTEKDWNLHAHKNKWPTLKWLKEHNKRVIIFNDNMKAAGSTSYTFYEWDHVIENQFGTFNMEKASCERPDSAACTDKKRMLFLLNYFGTITARQQSCIATNSCETLTSLMHKCAQQGYSRGRRPNFIALDHVHIGDAMKLVNSLNKLAEEKQRK